MYSSTKRLKYLAVIIIFGLFIYFCTVLLTSDRCYPAPDSWLCSIVASYQRLPISSYPKGVTNNGTVSEREKFQQNQVNLFCEKYNLNDKQTTYSLSKHTSSQLYVNKDSETLICSVPKAGCTSLMVLYFVSQGLLPKSVATTNPGKTVNHDIMIDLYAKTTLLNYDKESSTMALSKYYKFVMYRNPLERLVSAYRDKVGGRQLFGLRDNEPHYNWLRKCIYEYTYPQKFKKWASNGGWTPLNITFPDFVSFWLNTDNDRARHDPHLMPIFELCEPCRVRYDYYGNFVTFQQDAEVLVNKINSSMDFLRQDYYSNPNKETSKLTEYMYKQLSLEQKKGVLKRLAIDLDFYYHLFPAERTSMKGF